MIATYEPNHQITDDTALSKEFVATLLGRFRDVHKRLALSVEIYSSEIEAIVGEVESAFGYTPDSSYRKWLEAHPDVSAFLYDVHGAFEPFVERVREDMTFEV